MNLGIPVFFDRLPPTIVTNDQIGKTSAGPVTIVRDGAMHRSRAQHWAADGQPLRSQEVLLARTLVRWRRMPESGF